MFPSIDTAIYLCYGRDVFAKWDFTSRINSSIAVFPLHSGWARLAVYMDPIYSTKPLNVTAWMANRGSCRSETFSSSDVNLGTLFVSRSFSCCGKKGRANNFYPALNFISYPRIPPRDVPPATER